MSNICNICNKSFKNLNNHYKRTNPCIKDKQLWLSLIKKNSYKDSIFNTEQLEFIEYDLCDCKLLGIPGGGKTRCIIEKIKINYDRKVFSSNNNYLILSFSKKAQLDFIEKGNQVLQKKFNNNNVKTLHSLSGLIINKILGRNSGSLETTIISCINFIKSITKEEFIEKIPKLKEIKAIFIDETQDISGLQYEFVILLKNVLNCYLIMIGDPNQNIYQFQGGSDKYLLDYKVPTFQLKVNYRSTQPIIDFIKALSPHPVDMISGIDNSTQILEESTFCKNEKPIVFTGSIQVIIDNIIDEIKNTNIAYEDIAIIGPVKLCKQQYNGSYKSIGLSLITNILDQNNINFVKHYKDSNDEGVGSHENKTINIIKDHINILTIHGSKGLEFKKVILLNFHFNTFSSMPSLNDYNRFKYLWYVGISRAKIELKIYIDQDKFAWPLLKEVSKKLYNLEYNEEDLKIYRKKDENDTFKNILKYHDHLKFKEEEEVIIHSVTNILSSLTPEQLYKLEGLVKYTVIEEALYEIDKDVKLVDEEDLCLLYGSFAEKLYEYYYLNYKEKDSTIIFKRLLLELDNEILIPKKYMFICKNLCGKLGIKQEVNINFLNQNKDKFTEKELGLYYYLLGEYNKIINKSDIIFICYENEIFKHAKDEMIEICKDMITNKNNVKHYINLWKIVLYKYQKEYECGYLWNKDFTEYLEKFRYYVDFIEQNAKSQIDKDLIFQYETLNNYIPIIGIIDIWYKEKDEIMDIKFTKSLNDKQVYQVLLYYNNLYEDWSKPLNLSIINLRLGIKYIINVNLEILNNYNIMKYLSEVTEKKLKNTLFCYNLIDDNNAYYFEEYTLGFILTSNNNNLKMDLNEIFRYCEEPRFISYNDLDLDFKKNIFEKNGHYINREKQLLDARYIIRLLYIERDTQHYKIEDIYRLLFNDNETNVVKMCVKILKKLKYFNNN
jgi:hypothetical protein